MYRTGRIVFAFSFRRAFEPAHQTSKRDSCARAARMGVTMKRVAGAGPALIVFLLFLVCVLSPTTFHAQAQQQDQNANAPAGNFQGETTQEYNKRLEQLR